MIIVKVGGSLFDHPGLGPGLRAYLESLAPAEVLLIPGGGPVADAVRELDRVHGLGEEAAHWLALRALGATAELLRRLLEPAPPSPFPEKEGGSAWFDGRDCEPRGCDVSPLGSEHGTLLSAPPPSFSRMGDGGVGSSSVLDCHAFALEDEARPGALPHTWAVTTDSIAARAAVVFGAERLVLLKSTDIPPGTSWKTAAANGWVDAHFPQIARTLACPIEATNFRRQLDARA